MIAPIVLFVFARPDHTQRTINSLAANLLAKESDLIIYADAARNEVDLVNVNAVRGLIQTIKGFRSITIIERKSNYGLSKNIIEGVTEVCDRYGKAIVVEDDIVTSPYFLSYMNEALDKYKDAPDVWHISGWNYPLNVENIGSSFFCRVMNCWGWAVWADRWKYFNKNPKELISTWNKSKIDQFNLNGTNDFWQQVVKNHAGTLDTWAIFWYATIFEYEGLCLYPCQSFVWNIGNDGSGQNCTKNDLYSIDVLAERIPEFPEVYEESQIALQGIKLFYNNLPNLYGRKIVRWIRKIFY